jgi:hypothetical protein
MANNLTADHTLAFDEAYSLSGAYVTIEGESIRAIIPFELSEAQSFGDMGEMEFTGETNITVLADDLPTIDSESTVSLGGAEYRITNLSQEGTIAIRLTIEKP